MMEAECYGIQFSTSFKIPSISNEKLNISNKESSISIENLVFRSKNLVFQIEKFEILGFSPIEFEILGI